MSDTPSEFSGFEPSANPLQNRLAEVEDHTLSPSRSVLERRTATVLVGESMSGIRDQEGL